MTLIEVMVALVVVAVSLIAASSAFFQWANGSEQLHERMLASICARNMLTTLGIATVPPKIGTTTTSCEQDGLVFQIKTGVSKTPNTKSSRVKLNVFGPTFTDRSLFEITMVIGKL